MGAQFGEISHNVYARLHALRAPWCPVAGLIDRSVTTTEQRTRERGIKAVSRRQPDMPHLSRIEARPCGAQQQDCRRGRGRRAYGVAAM
ncbi:hypothetical protein E2562_011611 [Oryza meyeriana var. granulata]|uniref:Uncharacterized protein n=1 Tax=Oryza meyeriana var. granulata TaxID=110450 RepID=A0A6G1DWD8_9ORYZ|nr:hypothetical protein E2562_011611 [Oryza meyeriana var. granulata]